MKKSDKIISIVLVVAGLAVLGWCVGISFRAAQKPVHKLTIVHVNDTHSHLEVEKGGEYNLQGGALERAAYIDSVRTADGAGNVLLLHAGDFCQGSAYFAEFHGREEVALLNANRYDVVTLGNHEFDNGIEDMGKMLSGLKMPVVVCNYDFSPFEAGKYIKPYVIVEKAGLKIGVIGVLCGLKDVLASDIADRIPAFDTIPTVQKYVDEIRPECDLVILLTHIGYTEHNPGALTDPELCAATRGVDLIVGGHSHTFMDEAASAKNRDGKEIPIVQCGWMGVRMGEFHVTR